MRFGRPNLLSHAVDVETSNRPPRFVYLVPSEESDETHQILDAVFFESYTRWGGSHVDRSVLRRAG